MIRSVPCTFPHRKWAAPGRRADAEKLPPGRRLMHLDPDFAATRSASTAGRIEAGYAFSPILVTRSKGGPLGSHIATSSDGVFNEYALADDQVAVHHTPIKPRRIGHLTHQSII